MEVTGVQIEALEVKKAIPVTVQDVINHYINIEVEDFIKMLQSNQVHRLVIDDMAKEHRTKLSNVVIDVVQELPMELKDIECIYYEKDDALFYSLDDGSLSPTNILTISTRHGRFCYCSYQSILTDDIAKLGTLYQAYKPRI